jgi:uncharacterized protein (TIGR01244 family)
MRVSWMMVFVLATGLAACKKDKEAEAAGDPRPGEGAEPTAPVEPAEPPQPTLAEIGISNAAIVGDNVVTGGQVTDEQLAKAKELGVTAVVNLRSVAERAEYETEQAKVEELGMTYVHMPIDGATGDGLTEENARALAEIVARGEPTIVHCKTGQRAGALLALKALHVDNKSPEEALQVGSQAGLSAPSLINVLSAKMTEK